MREKRHYCLWWYVIIFNMVYLQAQGSIELEWYMRLKNVYMYIPNVLYIARTRKCIFWVPSIASPQILKQLTEIQFVFFFAIAVNRCIHDFVCLFVCFSFVNTLIFCFSVSSKVLCTWMVSRCNFAAIKL